MAKAAARFPTTLLEFQRKFPNEAACAAYLEAVRWPGGFFCLDCGVNGEPRRISTRPRLLRCRRCRKESSLTAGTILHATRTPLQVWFWAAYLVTTQTPGMSALQFQRQLGIGRYETAFHLLHKLRAAMVRPDQDRIGGEWPVEVDETYLGGVTRGEGRGVHHKATVVGAVDVRPKATAYGKRPAIMAGRLRLRVVRNRGPSTLEKFVKENVELGSHVTTDGWHGYDGLGKLGYDHEPIVLGGDPKKAEAALPMIHIVFSNLKTWLMGTHHGVSVQHLQAYLNEFVFRFNRRFYPMTAFASVLGIGTRVAGPTYAALYGQRWEDQAAGGDHHPQGPGVSTG